MENDLSAQLCDQIGNEKNVDEIFRVLSRFSALLAPSHIQGAIGEYQTQLIKRVKDNIESLRKKFESGYLASVLYRVNHLQGLPQVSGSIIWTRQLKRRLDVYTQRVEVVLGEGWEYHVEGKKLKADIDSFHAELDPEQLFKDWVTRVRSDTTRLICSVCALRPQMPLRVFDQGCCVADEFRRSSLRI